jgi:signal transduction histidine kinase/ActR/RegA family two-component response regulator
VLTGATQATSGRHARHAVIVGRLFPSLSLEFVTLSRHPPSSATLPHATAALKAAGAGRFVLSQGQLKLDAQARRLLGVPQATLALEAWLATLPKDAAQVMADAFTACLAAGDEALLRGGEDQAGAAQGVDLVVALGSRRLWWRGELTSTAQEAIAVSAQGTSPSLKAVGGGAARLQARIKGLLQVLPSEAAPAQPKPSQRDEFIAAISHELRTPLNAILGFTRLARADLPEQLEHQHLDHIEQASRLMLRVVNDLLDLTRLEAGKLAIDPHQPLNLPAVLTRVAAVASSLRQDKPVRLYTTVDPRCPMQLRGDVGRLEQILLNLVANALKFTSRGRIVLDARLRGQGPQGVTMRLSVSDTGSGMDLAQIERLGQPFEQGRDLSLQRLEGTGLGLTVVSRLLSLMGTQLRVASVAGGGSIFWFDITLPHDAALDRALPANALLANTPSACTHRQAALWTQDAKLQQTVETQWRAHGQPLLPAEQAGAAHCWLIDAAHEQAQPLLEQAERAGREAILVSAGPVLPGSKACPLPLLAQTFWVADARADFKLDPQLQGLKVLVAEDNALNQHVMREFLHRLGVDVVMAGDGPSALNLLGQRHVDVLVLDIQMPGMDGWTLARAVRALPHGASLPIIFLSAHIDSQDQALADALGARACLSKPFEPAVLHGLLRELASQAGLRERRFQAPGEGEAGLGKAAAPRAALLKLFAQQWPELSGAIESAMQACAGLQPCATPEQLEAALLCLRQAVHALRGSLAVLAQPGLLQRTRALEEGLLGGQMPDAPTLAALLHDLDDLARLPG